MEENNEVVEDVTFTTSEPTIEEKEDTSIEVKEEKTYTQKELDDIMSRRVARQEKKLRKEYESKYGKLENTIKAGLEVDDIETATSQLEEFYSKKGIKIPEMKESLDKKELTILANAEANEIIELGTEEMVSEANRLSSIGYDKLNDREKIVFTRLAETLTTNKRKEKLKEVGAEQEEIDSKDFNDFASKFNSNVDIKEVYDIYKKQTKKEKPKPIGTLKSGGVTEEVKEYYSFEESQKFTRKDYDDNPKLFQAVCNSMSKW